MYFPILSVECFEYISFCLFVCLNHSTNLVIRDLSDSEDQSVVDVVPVTSCSSLHLNTQASVTGFGHFPLL